MELGTFGAVLRFALELEAAVSAFHKSALGHATNPKLKRLSEGFVQRGEERVQLLMRLRRENTTEMLLEPITGLEGDRFRLQTELLKAAGDRGLARLATAMEERVQAFYTAAAEKVSFLSEAASIFERLAEENAENGRRLQALS